MLLFCGSIPTWILFINIFMKSAIVWILIPYDMFTNNLCLFLLYKENKDLYDLLCVNCHKLLFYQCFFPHFRKRSNYNDNQLEIIGTSHDIQDVEDNHDQKRNPKLNVIPSNSAPNDRSQNDVMFNNIDDDGIDDDID